MVDLILFLLVVLSLVVVLVGVIHLEDVFLQLLNLLLRSFRVFLLIAQQLVVEVHLQQQKGILVVIHHQ
jgi:hypothetical protein